MELAEAIATDLNVQGDTFEARLAQAVVSEGRLVARAQAKVRGRIVKVGNGTRDEPPFLALALESVQGMTGPLVVSTEPLVIQGERQSKLKRILKGAGGAVVGVIVGKKAGGTKGAVAGGAVGAVVAMRGNALALPVATVIQFEVGWLGAGRHSSVLGHALNDPALPPGQGMPRQCRAAGTRHLGSSRFRRWALIIHVGVSR